MIGQIFRNLLLHRGYFVSYLAGDGEISSLVDQLTPFETDRALIRVGGNGDGGYLVPDDLDGIRHCFSPGVAATATFETELAERGIHSFLADYSVDGPPVESDMFTFEKKFLGATNDDMYTTLQAWVERSVPKDSNDLILQMDIEGAEYGVIAHTPDHVWSRFRIVVVEFHGLHTMFNRYGLQYFNFCFGKLLRQFDIVHIHPNNVAIPARKGALEIPGVMEISFLRKDRIQWRTKRTAFPHTLDRPSIPGRRDVVLPRCWYR